MGHSSQQLKPMNNALKRRSSPILCPKRFTVSVGAVFVSHPEPALSGAEREDHEGHEVGLNRVSSIRNRVSKVGLHTRVWARAFHRPDCSISGVALSTNFHHEEHEEARR